VDGLGRPWPRPRTPASLCVRTRRRRARRKACNAAQSEVDFDYTMSDTIEGRAHLFQTHNANSDCVVVRSDGHGRLGQYQLSRSQRPDGHQSPSSVLVLHHAKGSVLTARIGSHPTRHLLFFRLSALSLHSGSGSPTLNGRLSWCKFSSLALTANSGLEMRLLSSRS